MASYTPTELRDAAQLYAGVAAALEVVYAKMYSAAISGDYTCVSDIITPKSIRDKVKEELGNAGYTVTENQGDATTLDISWAL